MNNAIKVLGGLTTSFVAIILGVATFLQDLKPSPPPLPPAAPPGAPPPPPLPPINGAARSIFEPLCIAQSTEFAPHSFRQTAEACIAYDATPIGRFGSTFDPNGTITPITSWYLRKGSGNNAYMYMRSLLWISSLRRKSPLTEEDHTYLGRASYSDNPTRCQTTTSWNLTDDLCTFPYLLNGSQTSKEWFSRAVLDTETLYANPAPDTSGAMDGSAYLVEIRETSYAFYTRTNVLDQFFVDTTVQSNPIASDFVSVDTRHTLESIPSKSYTFDRVARINQIPTQAFVVDLDVRTYVVTTGCGRKKILDGSMRTCADVQNANECEDYAVLQDDASIHLCRQGLSTLNTGSVVSIVCRVSELTCDEKRPMYLPTTMGPVTTFYANGFDTKPQYIHDCYDIYPGSPSLDATFLTRSTSTAMKDAKQVCESSFDNNFNLCYAKIGMMQGVPHFQCESLGGPNSASGNSAGNTISALNYFQTPLSTTGSCTGFVGSIQYTVGSQTYTMSVCDVDPTTTNDLDTGLTTIFAYHFEDRGDGKLYCNNFPLPTDIQPNSDPSAFQGTITSYDYTDATVWTPARLARMYSVFMTNYADESFNNFFFYLKAFCVENKQNTPPPPPSSPPPAPTPPPPRPPPSVPPPSPPTTR